MKGKNKKVSLKDKIFKNSIWNFLASSTSRIGAVIFTVLLARFLLPELFGIYSLATSIALIFLTFADLGVNQTMVRFVSLHIEKEKKKSTAYFQYILKIKIFLSVIVSFFLLFCSYPLSYFIFKKPDLFIPLVFLSFYVLILSLEGIFESLFYINNKVNYITIKEFILQFSRIVFVLIFFSIMVKEFYLIGAILSLVFTIILAFFFILYHSKKQFSFLFNKSKIKIDKKKVVLFIACLTAGSISLIFFSYVDILILGIFVSSEYIGFYRAAFSLVLGIMALLSFVNVFLPLLTNIPEERVKDVFNKIIRYTMILSIPSTTGLIILSRYIIVAVYGYEYSLSIWPLYILSPLIIISGIVGNLQTLFSARGKPQKFMTLIIFITFLNVFFNIIFISFMVRYSYLYGALGAGFATLLSWVIYLVGALFLANKEFGLSIRLRNFYSPVFSTLIMAIVLLLFNRLILDINLFLGIIEILLGASVYLLALLLSKGVTSEDKELIKSLFNNRFI